MKISILLFIFVVEIMLPTESKRAASKNKGRKFPAVATIENGRRPEQEETEEFANIEKEAENVVESRKRKDQKLLESEAFVEDKSPSSLHQTLLSTSRASIELSLDSLAIEAATNVTARRQSKKGSPNFGFEKVTAKELKESQQLILPLANFKPTSIFQTFLGQKHCHHSPVCHPSNDFRTYDGSCNNVAKPLVGKAGTPQIRLLPPAYQDPFQLLDPRTKATNGSPLPCARKVSQKLAPQFNKPNPDHTMMVMQWGQFVDHDLVLSPTAKLGYSGKGIECCEPPTEHPECFPICIPADDPFFSQYGRTCMNFVRTLPSPPIDCTMGPRQQMNALSHYLDGSNVYGSSITQMVDLRDSSGGKMKVQNPNLLPPQTNGGECRSPGRCFRAGDGRVNEQPNLALTHNLWVREHNRIAAHYTSLGYIHKDAFELARRLVVAEIQHITYNEFLPIVLGNTYMTLRNMQPAAPGYAYDAAVDASISNVFAAAAYRFGHSMIDSNIELHLSPTGNSQFSFPFSALTFYMLPNHFQNWRTWYANGLFKQPSQSVDMCFTKEVTEKLFQAGSPPGSGLDLVALNIQRGRDHGLHSYIFYKSLYCLGPFYPTINSIPWLTAAQKAALNSVYQSLEDVDLFVGGLLEPHVGGGIVGETFQCIIGDQFFRTKFGDRYYYENPSQPFPFTNAQLNEIRKVTLARIFCDNGDNINQISKNVFKRFTTPGNPNYPVTCNPSNIPEMNLSVFT